MLFTDSLRTSEVPKREQYYSRINMVDCLICKYLVTMGAFCRCTCKTDRVYCLSRFETEQTEE